MRLRSIFALVGAALVAAGAALSQTAVTPASIYDTVWNNITAQVSLTSQGTLAVTGASTLTGAVSMPAGVSTGGDIVQTNGTLNYVAAGGSADAQTLTYAPVVTAYKTGAMYCFKAVGSNTTTTPTLNVNGLGAKTMVKRASTAMAASDLLISGFYCGIYNGTNVQILNPAVP